MTHTAVRRPHPILKLKRDSSPFRAPALPFAAARPAALLSPHVHFPPTPGIAATYPAYSPTTYDRKPIVVSPNACQLPRRGARKLHSPPPEPDPPCEPRGLGPESCERGRDRGARRRGRAEDGDAIKGSYFHPRAYEACVPEPPLSPPPGGRVPALVQDLSPSDESDESVVVTPPGGTAVLGPPTRIPLRLADASKAPRRTPAPACSPSEPEPNSRANRDELRARRPELGRADRERKMRPRGGRAGSCSWSSELARDLDESCLGGF